ncbi:septum formation inhibitor Maf [Neisseria sp. N177_16]|nr:septum formation inhibitor Maf [Neisseria sp. N177_16]
MPNRTNDRAWKQAQNDFDSLRLQNIRQINTQYGQGRIGTLPDGRTVTVRPGSSNGSPTLQINSKTSNKVIKIRY